MTSTTSTSPDVSPAPTCVRGAFRRELAAAYTATGSRIVAWVIVTALVNRRLGLDAFGMLALVRSTIGLLNYTTVGLAPAMIRLLAANRQLPAHPTASLAGISDIDDGLAPSVNATPLSPASIYSSAAALAGAALVLGALLSLVYALNFRMIHRVPAGFGDASLVPFALFMGLGAVCKLTSDAAGAVLQMRGAIALDNLLIAAGEIVWMMLVVATLLPSHARGGADDGLHGLTLVAAMWAISGLFVFAARGLAARRRIGPGAIGVQQIRLPIVRALLAFGLFVSAAQMADFLYAPTDNFLINRLIDLRTVGIYAPAVQIDGGLLVLVSGLAGVLLPRSALAHQAGDMAGIRRNYLFGTAASAGLLAMSAIAIWLAAPWLLRIWLGNAMPETQAILPLILIHTVIGGSSAVGRSVLLAIGKVKPFTAAALIAGIANVALSYSFVKFFHLGLRGIVLGTIVAVVGRCAIWMPWYVLRSLRRAA